jgi:hypothetical protein
MQQTFSKQGRQSLQVPLLLDNLCSSLLSEPCHLPAMTSCLPACTVQVAKSLLDAATPKMGAVPTPALLQVRQMELCGECVGKLLSWREAALTAGLATDIAAAAARGGARAAAGAFDDGLDRVVGAATASAAATAAVAAAATVAIAAAACNVLVLR